MQNKYDRSSSSSSVGFFPNSSSLSDSDFSYSDSSNSNDFFGMTFFSQQLPPVNPHCWMENMFAELTIFTGNLLKQSGYSCPHSSPSKKNITAKNKDILTLINDRLLCAFPVDKKSIRLNQMLSDMEANAGRNYNNFMDKARILKDKIQCATEGNRELFLQDNNLTTSIVVLVSRDTAIMSTAALIMLLFLADKYPQAPQEVIFSFLKSDNLGKHNYDIYKAFRELDLELYTKFLTKEAIPTEERSLKEQFANSWGF